MINNLPKILTLLKFEEGYFYYVVVLKRKKEHPELGSNSYVVKHYYVQTQEALMFYWPDMQCLADFHNARVCINLNKRRFEALSFQVLKKVADQIMNKDFKSARKAYTSVCGAYQHDNQKKWIIDVDYKDAVWIETLAKLIARCEPLDRDKVLAYLPTKNGYHIITSPFNVQTFTAQLRQWRKNKITTNEIPDIQKNNPTILYIP